jgi:actin related protein 2/3 complex subunit 1A/1B
LNNEAFNRFKAADSRGQTSAPSANPSASAIAVGADGLLLTVHQNSITWVQPYEWSANGDVSKVSTAGRDGKLVIWSVTGKPAGAAGGLANRMGNLNM